MIWSVLLGFSCSLRLVMFGLFYVSFSSYVFVNLLLFKNSLILSVFDAFLVVVMI